MSKTWKREQRDSFAPKKTFKESQWEKENQKDYKNWENEYDDYEDEYPEDEE